MPKICENGIMREMTPEEVAQFTADIPEEKKDEVLERLEKLEELFDTLRKWLGVKE